jgi:hypothetical protein
MLHIQEHAPCAHDGVPFVVEHAKPHEPQLVALVVGSVHEEPQHSVCAPVHALPHTLQLSTSVFVLTQRPLQHASVPLQLPPSPAHASTHVPEGLQT